MNIKHGISLILWCNPFTNEDLGLIAQAKKLGYDGVELPVGNPAALDAHRLAETLHQHNMGCTLLPQQLRGFDLINPATHKWAIERFKELIRLGGKIGANTLAGAWYTDVGVGKHKHMRTNDEWKLAINSLRELAKTARQENMTLSLEPITRFETYFLNTAADAVQLIEETGEDNIGVNLDIYHMFMEESNLVETIVETGHHITHIHAAENHRGIPGTGMTNWAAVAKALDKVNYNGWIVFETLSPLLEKMIPCGCLWHDPMNGLTREEGAKQSLQYLKNFF